MPGPVEHLYLSLSLITQGNAYVAALPIQTRMVPCFCRPSGAVRSGALDVLTNPNQRNFHTWHLETG